MKQKHEQNTFHAIANANSAVPLAIQNKNQIIKHLNVSVWIMNYRLCKKYYSWNPSLCICENCKYLKSIADTSLIACDKILYVMDIVSIQITCTITISFHNEKKIWNGLLYFAQSTISDHITIYNYYYLLLL